MRPDIAQREAMKRAGVLRRLGHAALPRFVGAALLGAAPLAWGCDGDPQEPERRATVTGVVLDAQANTRLFFYDDELNQLDAFAVQVRQDGTFGPLAFPVGDFFGAGTASGFTTGAFEPIRVGSSDDSLHVQLDLDPITVPLAVGNRWTYDEITFTPAPDTTTVVVEITAQQPGEGVAAVFTVEERRTEPGTGGGGEPQTYFLAQDGTGIRKSADAVIDATDELLLRLPATLGTSWTTVDFDTGAQIEKRIRAIRCGDDGCVETNDFTIADERPLGVFMSVSVVHTMGDLAVVEVFSDIGQVDGFVQNTVEGRLLSQRKLGSFVPSAGS